MNGKDGVRGRYSPQKKPELGVDIVDNYHIAGKNTLENLDLIGSRTAKLRVPVYSEYFSG